MSSRTIEEFAKRQAAELAKDHAARFGVAAAAKHFNGRRGHGGGTQRVVYRNITEQQLATMLAAAWLTGYTEGERR